MDDFCWYMVALHCCWLAVIPLVECGLLEPKDDNPVELNEFLTNVLDHQSDFNYVKDVAKRYQNSRPQQQHQQLSSSFEYGSAAREPPKLYPKMAPYNLHAKRHAHNYHALKKRLKSLEGARTSKQRHRRHIKPPMLELEEMPLDDGGVMGGEKKMKKEAMDFASAVHKTNKVHKHTDNGLSNHENGNNNMYYVDLEGKRDDNNDRDDEKRSDFEQADGSRSNGEPNNIKNSKLEVVESGKAESSLSSAGSDDGSKLMKSEHDNTVDDTNYLASQQQQQHINDNSGFEKALSYEIEPSANKPEKNYDNPGIVNNAGSGADKSIVQQQQQSEELPAAEKYQQNINTKNEKVIPDQGHYPVPPEKYSENALKQIPNIENMLLGSSKEAVNPSKPNTIVKHMGNSFIEIDKQRRENAEERSFDQEEEGSLLKDRREDLENFGNEEPPLLEKEGFQGRKLQFFDESMINIDDGNEDTEYENFPAMMRPRRDFLDALGMKNEEDYSEDNPYKDDLKVNNTDVNNDTNIHKQSTLGHPGGCLVPGKTTSGTTTTTNKPQSEIDNIKHILEEPKEAAGDNTVGSFKNDKEKPEKRAKKTQYSKIEDFDDIVEGNNGQMRRDLRQVNEMEEKILQNKDKIFKYDPGKQEDCKKNSRQERNNAEVGDLSNNAIKKKKKKKNVQQHRINKKEDSEELTTVSSLVEGTTFGGDTANVTELEVNNSTYEQVAHQMDLENEKLAQVVNGRFASKIVTSVFDELKKKSALKTKFFSGLSRKHMNYDANIEVDIFKANDSEGVDEARLLLDQITKVLNRLVLNQVRRKLCQRLPDDLKDYLRTIVDVKNPIEVAGFVPNSQQGDFLFAYQQNPAETPPFNLRKLQETLVNLEGLLLSYHNLNADCQERAQPVKDYIERHVKMLRKIVACPDHSCESKTSESSRKRDVVPYNDLIEKQLESVGLGQKNRFIPNFDVNAIVKSKMGRSGAKRAASPARKFTEKFRKLQLAAEKVRQKREDERKIGELFGGMRKNKRSADEFEEPVVYSLGS